MEIRDDRRGVYSRIGIPRGLPDTLLEGEREDFGTCRSSLEGLPSRVLGPLSSLSGFVSSRRIVLSRFLQGARDDRSSFVPFETGIE
jgi:hypothetical protein